MTNKLYRNLVRSLVFFSYAIGLWFFYIHYVPLVKPFQYVFLPILAAVAILTAANVQSGILLFVFSFLLINNLPYFFGIYEPIPHAPSALVLALFFLLGFLFRLLFFGYHLSINHKIFRPIFLFSSIVIISGLITFARYTNYYPILSDNIYEMTANTFAVSTGGALMSIVFFSLNYLTGLGFFLIIYSTICSKQFQKKLVFVFCASALLSLSFGVYQHLINPKLGNNPISIDLSLINATFKDALSLGAFISIIAPFALGVCFTYKGILRILSFLVSILSLYVIFFAGSKSAFLSLFIFLSIFIFLSLTTIYSRIRAKSISYSLNKFHFSTWIVFLLIIGILLGSFILGELTSKEIIGSKTFQKFENWIIQPDFRDLYSGRANSFWKLAAYMIRDYPVTGIGMGSYIIEVANYSDEYKTRISDAESAENYVLQVGSELGLVGIFAVLWIFWEILKQIRKSYKSFSIYDGNKFLLIGAIAGIGAFILNIQAHTYIGSYEIKYTFWLLVGLIFSLTAQDRQTKIQANGVMSTRLFSKRFIIATVGLLVLYGGIHIWNSSHSLSLKNRTEHFGITHEFGLDKLEKTSDGREFRWTREYGGIPLKIEKPILIVAIHASHPDIQKKPVNVRIFLVEDYFKHKRFLKEITLTQNDWQDVVLSVPADLGQEAILLLKISRTWNPLKTTGVPDPRNLGVAVGKITFRDK